MTKVATYEEWRDALADCLMSCFAVFSLKWPSLLQYDRKRLDPLDPTNIRPAFKKILASLQRGRVLENFQFLGGYYLVSIDGTGHFHSDKIHCQNCCVKNHHNGTKSYYHNLLGAVIVKPGLKQVLPLFPEPCT